jgi:hypothetical protein
MLRIFVRIGTIDMYGFLGRDLHPLASDAGKVGQLVKLEQDAPEPYEAMGVAPVSIVTVKLDDGRLVELVDFEIASMQVELGDGEGNLAGGGPVDVVRS